MTITEWIGSDAIAKLEHPFVQESFNVPQSYVLLEGMQPMIVSAPHSVAQTRLGQPKQGEFRTGVLAQLLQKKYDCYAIYKTRNDGDDANFDERSAYKDAIKKLSDTRSIRYLLDLHIMSPQRDYMIDIGTGYGDNIEGKQEIVDRMTGLFAEHGIGPVRVDHLFPAAYPHTVSSSTFRHCRIPSVQLEINWRLLDTSDGVESFNRVYAALGGIVEYLLEEAP
ncbi:hypothetical protein [Paenibacillus thermotolerans]|uniref:hypothetical protein n=1 Tax=Paenibacillus thermotolerans TaxID=3027807 RepID=UPI0023675712|nr:MULTISPECIES: hypothetical protein [unclassified Paenibacillus]